MTDPIIQEVMALISKSGKSVTKIEEECGLVIEPTAQGEQRTVLICTTYKQS